MNRRLAAFVALAIVLGAIFVRLGFWQLDRRDERRVLNTALSAQLSLPPAPFADLIASDSASGNRRALVAGLPDDANEFVVTGRSRNGSPGVHIFTPVRMPGRDTAVLVNRGWVYSPDASSVNLGRWRERRSSFTGYTARMPPAGTIAVRDRGMRPLSLEGVARIVPYPVSPLYLIAQDSAGEGTPVRLDLPILDDGPHLSYAIQWFAFAIIAIGGAVLVVRRAKPGRTMVQVVQ